MNDNGELLRKIYVRADGEVYGTVRHTYRKRLAPMKKIQREEIQVSERPYTKAEAEAEAELEKWAAEEKLLEKGVHIIGNNVKIQENGFSFSIEGEILCEEQIAVFRQISEPEDEEEKSSMETGES